MKGNNGTALAISRRSATVSGPSNTITAAREERCAGILRKLRSVLSFDVLDDALDSPEWAVLAATFALQGSNWRSHIAYERLRDSLAGLVAAHVRQFHYVRLEHARVLNLLGALTWIADLNHDRDSWPRRGEEETFG